MTAADARFLLPSHPRSAVVLGPLDAWRAGLQEAGVSLADEGSAELVVTPRSTVDRALDVEADAVIVVGRTAARRLRSAGFHVRRYLPLPDPTDPGIYLPLDQPAPARYALDAWATPPTRVKRLRNLGVKALLGVGALPSARPILTVGTRRTALPAIVAGAASAGAGPVGGWFLAPARGDVLSRGLFSLFPPGGREPRWAVKFARVPGYADAFERDQRGLAVATSGGETVTTHAPRLVGRFEAQGLHASVETAAVGQRMTGYLHSAAPRAAKVRAVEAVARWIVEVAAATGDPPEHLVRERERLAAEVVPGWSHAGAPLDLVTRVPPVAAVLQHNDLGCWNVVVEGPRFTAVDWESARRHGFPLWDLWYFLADATAHLDEAQGHEARLRHFARLFRGELDLSSTAFEWTRRAAEVSRVPAEAVGTVACLCWLHHGLSHVGRGDALARHRPGSAAAHTITEDMARVWLSDPALGTDWTAWRESALSS